MARPYFARTRTKMVGLGRTISRPPPNGTVLSCAGRGYASEQISHQPGLIALCGDDARPLTADVTARRRFGGPASSENATASTGDQLASCQLHHAIRPKCFHLQPVAQADGVLWAGDDADPTGDAGGGLKRQLEVSSVRGKVQGASRAKARTQLAAGAGVRLHLDCAKGCA